MCVLDKTILISTANAMVLMVAKPIFRARSLLVALISMVLE